jgi:hypothetical protein
MKASRLAVFIGSASLTISSAMAAIQFGVDFTGGGDFQNNYDYSLGYEFQVTSPVSVVGLAAWDVNGSGGLPQSEAVGLWTDSGTLLRSSTIPAGTLPSDPGNQFAAVGISAITLNPGYYDVAAVGPYTYGNGEGYPPFTGYTVATGINFVEDRWITSPGVLAYPVNDDYNGGLAGWFGGNVVLGNETVPEPSTMIAGALMLLPFGSGAIRQLRKKL